MDDIIKKPGVHTLIFLGAIACFVFYQFFYPYHFYYQEQNQLFLGTWDYVLTYLEKPGWLACLSGDFFTQFYYYRALGPTILTTAILLAGYDIRHAVEETGVKGTWIPYTTASLAMLLLVAFSLDYDFRLYSVIAFIGGADVFRTSTKIMKKTILALKELDSLEGKKEFNTGMRLIHWIATFNIFISIPVCHWLFGNGVWVYMLLVIFGCIKNSHHPGSISRYLAIFVAFLLLLLGKRLYFIDFQSLYTYPGLGKLTLPQMDWEETFKADYEYYRGDYNKVIRMAEKEKNPTKHTKFYNNLVMAQNHSLTTNLLKFPENELGTLAKLDFNTSTSTLHSLNELSWVLGDMSFCKRTAMLCNIQSPDSRSIRMVKRLAEINLVTGDYDTARKYLRILQKTIVCRLWANRIIAALGKNADAEERATLQPYIDKQKYVNTQDTIRSSDNFYNIMQELIASNPDNYLAINYLLCSDLLQKDLRTFKEHYDAYYLRQQNILYSKLYQEALILYLTQSHAPQEAWSYYVKRQETLQQYRQYLQNPDSEAFQYTYWHYYNKTKKR